MFANCWNPASSIAPAFWRSSEIFGQGEERARNRKCYFHNSVRQTLYSPLEAGGRLGMETSGNVDSGNTGAEPISGGISTIIKTTFHHGPSHSFFFSFSIY